MTIMENEKERMRRLIQQHPNIMVVGLALGTNPNWDKGIWRKFAVYYINEGGMAERFWLSGDVKKDSPPYWIGRHKTKSGKYVGGYFESNGLGSDRVYGIVAGLKRWLGLGDDTHINYTFMSESS